MTPTDLAAIEARVKEATSGPWGHGKRADDVLGDDPTVYTGGGTSIHDVSADKNRPRNVRVLLTMNGNFPAMDDAIFIAHAREDVEALAKEVRRLLAVEAEMRSEVNGRAVSFFHDGGVIVGRCDMCRHSWPNNADESHAAGCLAEEQP